MEVHPVGGEARPVGIKITRKLLEDYRKMKREIPLLEAKLAEMQQGQNGFDNCTVFGV